MNLKYKLQRVIFTDCQYERFGKRCEQVCNCSAGFNCEPITGKCICKGKVLNGACHDSSTTKSLEAGGVSEPQKNMINDDIGTVTVASVSNPPEGCSIPLQIHIFIISVSAAILLVWLAAASVKIICDSRGQCGRISEMYNRQNDRRRDLDQQQHNTAMTVNPYCETWEATSSV
ncbi:unnamed protein product [Mytilus coruscus]|uniref:Uncharacterized protein n=1 Tax=Mytilus coruscus TaxID=42192 RepID=A0A6J8EWA8_MYTCO|nr:unnamed protein product [Mytilus coruscus]